MFSGPTCPTTAVATTNGVAYVHAGLARCVQGNFKQVQHRLAIPSSMMLFLPQCCGAAHQPPDSCNAGLRPSWATRQTPAGGG